MIHARFIDDGIEVEASFDTLEEYFECKGKFRDRKAAEEEAAESEERRKAEDMIETAIKEIKAVNKKRTEGRATLHRLFTDAIHTAFDHAIAPREFIDMLFKTMSSTENSVEEDGENGEDGKDAAGEAGED